MTRYLITGGLGFLGHHLAKLLLASDGSSSITIVDDLSSVPRDWKWLADAGAEVLVQDLRDFAYEGRRFDEIYHLASPVGCLGILSRCGKITKEIVDLTHRAVEIALHNNAKLLFVSSSEVYGESVSWQEDAALVQRATPGARNEYSIGKLASEIILRNTALCEPLRYNICRPFNTFGEFQSPEIGFVVPRFILQAIREQDIEVFQPGLQKRAFCHASDTVAAFTCIQRSSLEGEILNVGDPRNLVSIMELAETIKSICRSASKIVTVDPTAVYGPAYVEAPDKVPDTGRIGRLLGWQPKRDFHDSLRRTYEHYRALAS